MTTRLRPFTRGLGFRALPCSGLLALGVALAVQARPPVPATAPTSPLAVDTVRVHAPGAPALALDRDALAALPRTQVTGAIHGETPADWDGVALTELLRRAGAPLDQRLRGKAMASVVRVTAADGYRVVFSLAELDPAFGNATVVLADHRDGAPLAVDGPFRLVVPGDARGARWVRDVEAIEVIDVIDAPGDTP